MYIYIYIYVSLCYVMVICITCSKKIYLFYKYLYRCSVVHFKYLVVPKNFKS